MDCLHPRQFPFETVRVPLLDPELLAWGSGGLDVSESPHRDGSACLALIWGAIDGAKHLLGEKRPPWTAGSMGDSRGAGDSSKALDGDKSNGSGARGLLKLAAADIFGATSSCVEEPFG